QRAFARRQIFAIVKGNSSGGVTTTMVNVHARAIFYGTLGPPGNLEEHVDNAARSSEFGQGDHIAAMNILDIIERKIERGARARPAGFQIAVVGLDTANASRLGRGLNHGGMSATQHSSAQRASDHRADALQFKYAVDGKTWLADIRRRRRIREHLRKSGLHVANSSPCDNRCGDDWRIRKRRVLQFFANRGYCSLFVLR